MINAVGLQNPGIDVVISKEIPELRKVYHKPIVANISGFSVDEYVQCCAKADGCTDIDIVELNVSCPNVHGGGMSFGTDPRAAAEVTKAVKAVTAKPVIVKLSPNVTDIVSIAKACEDAGADGISHIYPPEDPAQDESDALAALPQDILARLILPLGSFTPEDVQEMAADFNV